MSDKKKNCGSCRFSSIPRWQVMDYIACDHPYPRLKTPLPSSISIAKREMKPTDGTACPCHEPREERDE